MIPEARFAYRHYGSIIVIDDICGDGICKSVTNDIENVINTVADYVDVFETKYVIYRDSDYRYDEIIIKNNKFSTFSPINTKSLTHALKFIVNKYQIKGE